jgi:hypothetical protein
VCSKAAAAVEVDVEVDALEASKALKASKVPDSLAEGLALDSSRTWECTCHMQPSRISTWCW